MDFEGVPVVGNKLGDVVGFSVTGDVVGRLLGFSGGFLVGRSVGSLVTGVDVVV